MRVMLINPASLQDRRAGPYSKLMFPIAPLGLAYLAAVARDLGHEVIVEDQYASGMPATTIARRAEEFQAEVVGLSCLSPNVPAVGEIVRAIRARRPGAFIVLGNLHAAYFAREMLAELPIDAVALGEGEGVFAALLNRLAEGSEPAGLPGLATATGALPRFGAEPPLLPLEKIPRPAWELFRLGDYRCPPRFMMRGRMLPVQASRGCPYRCAYCSQNLFHRHVRRRELVAVVEEIAWLRERFAITGFGFTDALFPMAEEDGLTFCRLLVERGLHRQVRWFTETRYDRMTPRLLQELKHAGCRFLMYGFETSSPRLLELVGKQVDPTQALDTIRWTKEAGLGSYGLFMIGFPTETLAEARETIRFAKRLDCDVVSFGRVTPYPGSDLYEKYRASFDTTVPPWQWNNQYRPLPGETMWRLPGLSHEEITALIREAMISYYLRPRLIWRHLRRGTFTLPELLAGAWSMIRDLVAHLWAPLRRHRPPAVPSATNEQPPD